MATYDQFFKKLFETFFADLLRLVAPEVSTTLVLERVQFRDKQSFTDWPAGSRREMDLLAEVECRDGEPGVLVHVEIESRARPTMPLRLWQYYMQLRLRAGLVVIPILVNLKGGPPGVTVQTRTEGIGGLKIARFEHLCFGVSGCLAEEFLSRPEPLAWGLAALMKSRRWNRAEQKVECLRRIAEARLSGLGPLLLVNCVETYLQLTPDEAAAFEKLRATLGTEEVKTMQLTWADRMIEQGLQQGMQKGLASGLRSLKDVVLRLLAQRFGPVPARVSRRIEAIEALEPLERIAGEILTARSLDDVQLD